MREDVLKLAKNFFLLSLNSIMYPNFLNISIVIGHRLIAK